MPTYRVREHNERANQEKIRTAKNKTNTNEGLFLPNQGTKYHYCCTRCVPDKHPRWHTPRDETPINKRFSTKKKGGTHNEYGFGKISSIYFHRRIIARRFSLSPLSINSAWQNVSSEGAYFRHTWYVCLPILADVIDFVLQRPFACRLLPRFA